MGGTPTEYKEEGQNSWFDDGVFFIMETVHVMDSWSPLGEDFYGNVKCVTFNNNKTINSVFLLRS